MSVASTDLTTSAVASALRGRRVDLSGTVFRGALFATLAFTVVVLLTLLVSVVQEGLIRQMRR